MADSRVKVASGGGLQRRWVDVYWAVQDCGVGAVLGFQESSGGEVALVTPSAVVYLTPEQLLTLAGKLEALAQSILANEAP